MLLQRFTKTGIIFTLFCATMFAADTTNSPASDKRLVEVIFATDDRPTNQTYHTVRTLWVSERNRGSSADIYGWAHQGGYNPDPDTRKKAAECLELLKPIDQPKDLPESPNQIVTVRCLDGETTIMKRFPIDRVPTEVHQILSIMGFRETDFSRLKFVQKAGQTTTNAVENPLSRGFGG